MVADLTGRSYKSSNLWETFLEGIPTPEQISDLYKKDEWKQFIDSCTGEEVDNQYSLNRSRSNEKEFKKLVQCVVNLEGLREHFGQETTENNPRWGRVRISHQGNHRISTWNTKAGWLTGDYGSTKKNFELKPDLISVVVKHTENQYPRKAQPSYIQFAKPKTILPPPDD